MAPFSAETRARLAAYLPFAASTSNPVDMVASAGPDEYRQAIQVVLADKDTDALLVIYAPVDIKQAEATLTAIREGIAVARRAGSSQKPSSRVRDGRCRSPATARQRPTRGSRLTHFPRMPSARSPRSRPMPSGDRSHLACCGASMMSIRRKRGRSVVARLRRGARTWLTDEELRRVLHAFNLPLVASAVAHSADDAAAAAALLGLPGGRQDSLRYVFNTRRKSVASFSIFPTRTPSAHAFDEIMARAKKAGVSETVHGVLIQPMLKGGVETMIGVAADRLFGPLIGFGLGGIFVELMGDMRFRIAPLTDRDADELIHDIRGFPLLNGYRGQPAADVDALRDVLLRISRLADEVPEIVELDLNPVIALPDGHGCRIVDARIRVRPVTKA